MIVKRLQEENLDAGEISEPVEELLDTLDTALMKRGTLNANTIDWEQVGKDARAVLEECLHLRALRALIFALGQTPTEEALEEAMQLAEAGFAPGAWALFHPQGPKAERRRTQWGADILSALQQSQKQIERQTRGLPKEFLARAEALGKTAASIGIDSSAYQVAVNQLHERGEPAPAAQQVEQEHHSDASVELDARGRAELRRDIRSLADRIGRHEPGAEIAFQMRRYGAWLDFRTLPPVDSENRTTQYPMPSDMVDEFRSLAERPTDNGLMKLEDQLFHSPDWLEGQRLATRIASALGYKAAAETIHHAVARRFADMPGLAGLRFVTGNPYFDPALLEWVHQAKMGGSTDEAEDAEGEEREEPTLEDRIAARETNVASQRSRRARAVAKLALAKELLAAGLSSHAGFLLQELVETLSDPVLASWDSELADDVRSAQSRKG
ncbi:MAG: type VI secretion system domain-containing protein [Rhizobiaceae bacterium]|nr:type VI secretion system domain-containing protein [Rhizobiaceae bacterium]